MGAVISGAANDPVDRAEDTWPRTSRILPWLLAIFVVAVCLVPLDSSELRVSLPIDPKLDRVVLFPVLALWAAALFVGGKSAPSIPRLGSTGIAILLWIFVGVLSVLLAYPSLVLEAQVLQSVKKLLIVAVLAGFYLFVASSVRKDEIQPLITVWIVASSVAALDALVTYQTGTAHLRELFATVAGSVFSVAPAPSDLTPNGKPYVVGPALHGLALTTMMAMVMPFALQRVLDARTFVGRALPALSLVLFAVAAATTGRRSALIVPAVLVLVLFFYRPRQMLKLAPLLLVFVAVSQIVAPAALSTISARFKGGDGQTSSAGRTSDYDAVWPDIVSHPLFGKGFGTIDPSVYRILDNQMLTSLIETGIVGLLAFVGVLVVAWAGAHRRALDGDALSLGVVAAVAAFATSTLLYDTLAFVQSAYLLFFVLGLSAAARRGERGGEADGEPAPSESGGVLRSGIRSRAFVPALMVAGLGLGWAVGSGLTSSTPVHFGRASTTVKIEQRPEELGNPSASLRFVYQRALTISQMVGSGAVSRRVAEQAGLPLEDVWSRSFPSRVEQPSELRTGVGDQRAVALFATQAPVYITSDMTVGSPSFRLVVRAPSADEAERIVPLVVQALHSELNTLAAPGRSKFVPVLATDVSTSTGAVAPAVFVALGASLAFGVFALAFQALFAPTARKRLAIQSIPVESSA